MKLRKLSGRLAAVGMVVLAVASVGCQNRAEPATSPTATTPVTQVPRGTYRPDAAAGMAVNQLAFPTGEVPTSAVLLSTVMPMEVRAGQTYSYQLHVTNLTNTTLQGVSVGASDVSNLEVTASTPQATRSGNATSWNIGNLPAGETRVVEVTGRAPAVGNAAACFSVIYNNLLCTTVRVVQPALAVTKTAPAEVLICDPIPFVFEVRNTGTGTAQGVRLRDQLPSGLTTTDGQTTVDALVGDLAAGQAKNVTIQVKAARTGSYNNTGSVASAGGLTAQSNQTTTVVRQPVLALTCEAPERIFVGRNATFAFNVRNTGDGVSRNTVVTVPLPSGATLVSSTGGTPGANGVSFNVGDLAPGATKQVGMTVTPSGISTFSTTATAQGVCANPVTTTCSTAIQGIPAILLEVVDLVDPVEVGGQTTYVIQATNQGSAPGTGITIVAELAGEQDYVSSAGATVGTVAGKTVTFAKLPSLAPKAKAEWRIVVRANNPSDVRFRVRMTSDQFSKPVEETESTNQYR